MANTRNLSIDDDYIFDADIPLTEKGIKQANKTGELLAKYCKENNIDLKKSILWVSPFLRTEETARIINKHLGISKVYNDPRLSELDFGLFDQRSRSDSFKIDREIFENIANKSSSLKGKFYARQPNGESPFDVYNRISTFIETIYRDNDTNLFIVSHGITLRVFIMRMLHYSIEWYYNEKNSENASVRLLQKEKNQFQDKGYIINSKI